MEKLRDTWQEVRKGLFVVDPDVECKRFLDRMVQMARRNNAEFTLVHCLEEPSRWKCSAREVHGLLKREWHRELDQPVAAHGAQGLKIDWVLLIGDPMKEIAEPRRARWLRPCRQGGL